MSDETTRESSLEEILQDDSDHNQEQGQEHVPTTETHTETEAITTPPPKKPTAKKRVSHENNDTVIPRNDSQDSDGSKDDEELDEEEVLFLAPAEGTPAALALQG